MLDHKNPRDAAAISYFSLLALFPAVLVLLAVANDILNLLGIKQGLVKRIVSLFPVSQKFLDANLSQIIDPSPGLVLSCMVVVFWTSTWVFSFVENALNRAWDVPKRRTFWESRLRSITVIVLGGTILLASTGITAIVGKAQDQTSEVFRQDEIITGLWSSILLAIGSLLAVLVFFCVFKLMPDRKVLWQEALSGAVVAAALWEMGSYIFVKLFPSFDLERVYGRTGAMIALLAWVYTSNLIMLFGANFSAQLHGPPNDQRAKVPEPGRGRKDPEDLSGQVVSSQTPGSHRL